MQHLFERLPVHCQGAWAKSSADLEDALRGDLAAGDVVDIDAVIVVGGWYTGRSISRV